MFAEDEKGEYFYERTKTWSEDNVVLFTCVFT